MPVGPAAFDGQNNVTRRNLFATHVIYLRQKTPHDFHTRFHRFRRSPEILDHQNRWGLALRRRLADSHELVLLEEIVDLRLLAPQPDQHVGADVRVPSESGQHAIEHLMGRAAERHAATCAVSDCEHPVHVGEIPSSEGPNRRAMYLETDAEQFTLDSTAMVLRVPVLPPARR